MQARTKAEQARRDAEVQRRAADEELGIAAAERERARAQQVSFVCNVARVDSASRAAPPAGSVEFLDKGQIGIGGGV